ncbi:MAG: M48 family metallopeptidase [Dehalococcoidia bacterium]
MEELLKLAGLAIAAVVVAGAAYTYFTAEEQTVPITGREQRVGMTEDEQKALGAQAFREVLSEPGIRTVTGPDADLVRRVGERIARVADDPGFEWEYAVVDSPLVNAFCLPGGKVVVYTGLLSVTRDEAELATVMAHEIAHAIAQHGAERVLQQQLAQAVGSALAAGLGGTDPGQRAAILALFGAGAQFGVLLPFGREQESEADRIGLIYMARAGYDPRAAISFWTKMAAAQSGPQPPEYASTHPSHERRIADIEGWLPEALDEYEAARSALDQLPGHPRAVAGRPRLRITHATA